MSKGFDRKAGSPAISIPESPGIASGLPSFSRETTTTTPNPFSQVMSAGTIKLSASNLDAVSIARRIVDFCHEHGDHVSNLKLQKLLYYCQAWYLAIHGKPLFKGRFEAWPNGPTQPDVYAIFRRFGDRPIEQPPYEWHLPQSVESHIADLMTSYGRLSAFELERLSCQEDPWIEARRGLEPDESSKAEIPTDTMKRYYKGRLDEQKDGRQ